MPNGDGSGRLHGWPPVRLLTHGACNHAKCVLGQGGHSVNAFDGAATVCHGHVPAPLRRGRRVRCRKGAVGCGRRRGVCRCSRGGRLLRVHLEGRRRDGPQRGSHQVWHNFAQNRLPAAGPRVNGRWSCCRCIGDRLEPGQAGIAVVLAVNHRGCAV